MKSLINILHLEHDPADMALVQAELTKTGLDIHITRAQTQDEFKVALHNEGLDIILADFQLPMYDGLSALRLAKQLRPDIPFIFVSGTMGEEAAIEVLTQGATDYVLKQNLTRLASAVQRALQEVRERRDRKQAEQQVALMNFALNSIHEAAFLIDAKACFQYVNEEACRLLGYTRDELLSMRIPDISPGFSMQSWPDHWNDLKKHGTLTLEREFKTKDGRLFPVEISASYFEYEGQSYNLGLVRDITERKQSEIRLNEQVHFLQQLLDSIPIPVYYKDRKGLYLGCNVAFEDLIGLPRKDIIGKTVQQVVPHERADKHHAADLALLRHPGMQSYEVSGIYQDGQHHDMIYHKATFVDAHGGVAGTVGTLMDVTELKRAYRDLLESEARYRLIAENTADTISVFDLDLHPIYVSPSVQKLRGYTAQEAMAQSLDQVLTTESLQKAKQILAEQLALEESGDIDPARTVLIELEQYRKDGSKIWVELAASALRDDDLQVIGVLTVSRDITERKKLEEQLRQSQKMEAVGQLAGGVAHDFNNMLGVIVGSAEMALEAAAEHNSLRKHLEAILTAGHRSVEITRQLLAFARKQAIAPKILDLNETVEGMFKLLRRLIGEGIDLVWLPGAKLGSIKVDPSQIDQIMANLCVNARDAIAGKGKVTIETHNVVLDDAYCAKHEGSYPGEYVMLAVSDNGSGMDKQTIDKIFEPFFTTKVLGQGTGLGLSTVYGIVKQNSGYIDVESEPEHGATFKIYFPRHAIKTEQTEEQRFKAPTARGDETILVVEDEATFLEIVELMLKSLGYEVLTASTPSEALGVASDNPGKLSLLITDIIMPEMKGQELVEKLLLHCPHLRYMFMSGYSGNMIADYSSLDERINFIQKPFSIQELSVKVRKVLDSH